MNEVETFCSRGSGWWPTLMLMMWAERARERERERERSGAASAGERGESRLSPTFSFPRGSPHSPPSSAAYLSPSSKTTTFTKSPTSYLSSSHFNLVRQTITISKLKGNTFPREENKALHFQSIIVFTSTCIPTSLTSGYVPISYFLTD